MDVFDLYAKIEIDLTTYQNNLRRAVDMARTASGDIQTAMQNVGTSTQNANTQTVTYNTTLVNVATQSHNAERASKNFGDVLKDIGGKAMDAAKKVGSMMTDIAKGAGAAVGVAGAALSGLTKQALGQVAEYEQLVGGVDTLFKESSEKIQQYANEAYRTAGLSANEYMQTTINFSGSLIRALKGDTEKAAEMSNLAITDMADNVNKLGTSMDMVQNAYRGLARQNFTMIDNLSLGYSGTAEGMAQLINESGVLNGTMEATADNVKEIGFDKYIEAIHKIQEIRGITGTTSLEAEKTISGSMASMKAAWKNFLTGVGDGKQFTEALTTAMGNIRKNLKDIIPRLSEGLTELIDQIAPEIPPIIEEMLPAIIDGSSSLIKGLAKRLPQIIKSVLPALTKGVVDVVGATVNVLPQLIRSVSQTIPIVINTIMSKKDDLKAAGKKIIEELFPNGADDISTMTANAISLVTRFVAKITDPTVMSNVITAGSDIVGGIIQGMTSEEALDALMDDNSGLPVIISSIISGLGELAGNLVDGAETIISNLVSYFTDQKNKRTIREGAGDILDALGTSFVNLSHTIYSDIVQLMEDIMWDMLGAFDGDKAALEILKKIGKGFVNLEMDSVSKALGPATMFWKWWGDTGVDMSGDQAFLDSIDAYGESFPGTADQWYGEEGARWRAEVAARRRLSSTYDATNDSIFTNHAGGQAAYDAYMRSINHYAVGGVFDKPTYALIGEDGAEAVMPLEKNTGWIDRLAERLGGGGSVVIQFGDIHVNGTKDAGREVVASIDNALRQYQIMQQRGVGGTGWQ